MAASARSPTVPVMTGTLLFFGLSICPSVSAHQLRGALPYHGAIRGTIITLGKFAKGCKEAAFFQGAAPITLIDGDSLIEMLVKHEIGISKRPVDLLEVDTEFFEEQSEIESEDDVAVSPNTISD